MDKLKCPACGFLNEHNAEVCVHCGQRLRAREVSELMSPWGSREAGAESVPGGEPGGAVPPRAEVPSEPRELREPREPPSQEPPVAAGVGPETAAGDEASGQVQEQAPAGKEQRSAGESVRYTFAPAVGPTRVMVVPAGLGRRTMALLIDLTVIIFLSGVMLALTGAQWIVTEYQARVVSTGQGLLSTASLPLEIASAWNYLSLIAFILIVGYFGIFSGFGGQTPGKALVGIKLLHRDGREVSLWIGILRALLMWLAIYLFFGFYLLFAGFMVLLDREGRSLHDYFFSTNVYFLPRPQG